MANPTPRLGLMRPTIASAFSTSDLADNWDRIDETPGVLLTEHATLPGGWGNNHRGMLAYATDQGLYWRWDGSEFVRAFPAGLLGQDRRTSDFTMSSASTYESAVSVDVDVPPGGLSTQVVVEWHKAEADSGALVCQIRRDATVLAEWVLVGQTSPDAFYKRGQGGSRVTLDVEPPDGQRTYALYIKGLDTGSNHLRATAESPVAISVTEV